MSRYTGPKAKLSRREGVSLFDSTNKVLQKRNYPPGIHGNKRKPRLTPYAKQLREKQKVKRTYGVTERQFVNYYKKASQKEGNTGETLLTMLENRLDNVVYKMGVARSRPHARQLVNHGFFVINDKKVDIPSYQVKIKDTIKIKANKTSKKVFENLKKLLEKYQFPSWVHFDIEKMEGKIISRPDIEPLKAYADMTQIVEFYSR